MEPSVEELLARIFFADPTSLELSASIQIDRILFTPGPIDTQIIGTDEVNGFPRSRNCLNELSEQGKIYFCFLCKELCFCFLCKELRREELGQGEGFSKFHIDCGISWTTTHHDFVETLSETINIIEAREACKSDDKHHEFWSYVLSNAYKFAWFPKVQ